MPEWLIISCSGVRRAIPLHYVREILEPLPYTRLPGCGPEVCGLIGFRGRIVTVFDIGSLLGLRPSRSIPDHRVLLFEDGAEPVAGAVDEVIMVAPTATEEVLDLGPVLDRLLI